MLSTQEPSGVKILVVDDDPTICKLLEGVLLTEGYQPELCLHPQQALALSGQERFGLAFVDINLPEMSGLDLAAKIKEHDPHCEVVFITGSGAIENAVQALKIGAYDYLRKPFTLTEFNLCLKRFQERRLLKERIRFAEQRYFDLVQNIPLLVYVLTKDFQLDFVNQACLAMLGYTPEEAMQTQDWFVERIHTKDRRAIMDLLQKLFVSGGPPATVEGRLVHKQGHLINVIIKSIPYHGCGAGREVNCLEGIIVDITDHVFLERALVQKEKLKTLGAISAEVAHEIRNPLVSIGGFARRLQTKYPNLHEVEIILRESQRLEKILDRIRNYLKPVDIRHEQCPVNPIIRDSIELLAPEIERRSVICRLQLDAGQPLVYVDRDVLGQVFINLIRNALVAMEKDEILTIKSFVSGQSIHIDFRNQTCSPKIKNPELLFLPFDEGGQSIGLPLCYTLLKSMGGLLSFAQEQDHVTFTVSLPKTIGAECGNGHLAKVTRSSAEPT
jgi:two-component system sensor histidine kinase HydH